MLLLSAGISLTLARGLVGSSNALGRAAGTTYDRATPVVGAVLAVGDALIFLDYAHWHLVPALERTPLQALGLALGASATALIARTDAQLARHFEDPASGRTLITTGPFGYVRHPRYAGILGVRVAYALTFASAIGWLLAVAWLIVLLRRLRLEETYLRAELGESYDRYAARTPRLIPGLY